MVLCICIVNMMMYFFVSSVGSCFILEVISGFFWGFCYFVEFINFFCFLLILGSVFLSDLLMKDLEVLGKYVMMNWNLDVSFFCVFGFVIVFFSCMVFDNYCYNWIFSKWNGSWWMWVVLMEYCWILS